MLEVRRGAERFCTRTDWLTSWHSFSYGPWYDPDNVAFGPLTVFNHDVLAPGAGFDEHRHSGHDLVTYVVAGALLHRDSTGHEAVVRAGEVQVLRSGSGVSHSERNASALEPVEYVQMWLRSDNPVTQYGGSLSSPSDATFVALPDGAFRHVVLQSPGDRLVLAGGQVLAYVLAGELALGQDRVVAGDAVLVSGSSSAVLDFLDAEARVVVWELYDPPRGPRKDN